MFFWWFLTTFEFLLYCLVKCNMCISFCWFFFAYSLCIPFCFFAVWYTTCAHILFHCAYIIYHITLIIILSSIHLLDKAKLSLVLFLIRQFFVNFHHWHSNDFCDVNWHLSIIFILIVDVLTSRTPPTSLLTTSNDDNTYSIKQIVQGTHFVHVCNFLVPNCCWGNEIKHDVTLNRRKRHEP